MAFSTLTFLKKKINNRMLSLKALKSYKKVPIGLKDNFKRLSDYQLDAQNQKNINDVGYKVL
jgi:hypothetical protein